MAASVRIEDEAFSDVRYDVLATLCQLADADHARGKMALLWRQCTAQQRHVLPVSIVCAVLGARGADSLVESGLGEAHQDGIRIRGTRGRIEWLKKLKQNAKKGGFARAAKRQPVGKQEAAKSLPSSSPPAPAPAPAPIQENKNSDTPAAVGSLDLFKAKVDAAVGAVGKKRASKAASISPDEMAAARRVLAKLSERNGVRYSGTTEHVRLIVAQLRRGHTEADLGTVIAYCATKLEWSAQPEMAVYLRPETLFGSKTIARYLDPARAWSAPRPVAVANASTDDDEPDLTYAGMGVPS